MKSLIFLLLLTGCGASLPPNSPKEHSSYIQCARSSPIAGWGGGTVWIISLDSTKEGGSFEMAGDCGGVKAVMNQKAASAPK